LHAGDVAGTPTTARTYTPTITITSKYVHFKPQDKKTIFEQPKIWGAAALPSAATPLPVWVPNSHCILGSYLMDYSDPGKLPWASLS